MGSFFPPFSSDGLRGDCPSFFFWAQSRPSPLRFLLFLLAGDLFSVFNVNRCVPHPPFCPHSFCPQPPTFSAFPSLSIFQTLSCPSTHCLFFLFFCVFHTKKSRLFFFSRLFFSNIKKLSRFFLFSFVGSPKNHDPIRQFDFPLPFFLAPPCCVSSFFVGKFSFLVSFFSNGSDLFSHLFFPSIFLFYSTVVNADISPALPPPRSPR